MAKFEKGQVANPIGRPKGASNKENKAIREMIVEALDELGGIEYLKQQAIDNPNAFMSLIAKVLPTQITGEGGGAIKMEDVTTPEQVEALKQFALLKYGLNPATI